MRRLRTIQFVFALLVLPLSAIAQASMLAIGLRDQDSVAIQGFRDNGEQRVLIWNRTDDSLEIQFREIRYHDFGSRFERETDQPIGAPIRVGPDQVITRPRPRVSDGSYIGVRRNGEHIGLMMPTDVALPTDQATHAILLDGTVNSSFRPSSFGSPILSLSKWPSPGETMEFEILIQSAVSEFEIGDCLGNVFWPCLGLSSFECQTAQLTVVDGEFRAAFSDSQLVEGSPHRGRGSVEIPSDIESPVVLIYAAVSAKGGSSGLRWMVCLDTQSAVDR